MTLSLSAAAAADAKFASLSSSGAAAGGVNEALT